MNIQYQLEQQLLEKQQQKQVDSTINTVRGIIKAVKYQAEVLQEHEGQYNWLNSKMDNQEQRANKTLSKMKSYLSRASNMMLYGALAIEGVVLILLISN